MWGCVISLTGCGLVVNAQCTVVISLLQNVDYGGQIPSGLEDAPAIIVTGAREGLTSGGPATAESKCVYYYEPDSDVLGADPKYDGEAQFVGPDWPYVETDSNCTIEIDESIPEVSVFRNPGYVTISTYDGLLFGGLPLYFYPDDAPGVGPDFEGLNCRCNFGPWTSVDEDGQGTTITVRQLPTSDTAQSQTDITTPQSTDAATPQDSYDNTVDLAGGDVVLDYTLTSDNLRGRATVHKNVGWLGIGFGPGGMVGSNAVIGQVSANGLVQEYALTSKSNSGILPTDTNSVTDGVFTSGDDSSALTFSIPVTFGEVGIKAGVENNIIWAYGGAESISYHDARDEDTVVLTLSTAKDDTAVSNTASSTAESSLFDTMTSTAVPAQTDSPAGTNRIILDNGGPLFDYTINDTHLRGTATLPQVVGWLAIGFGPGGMVGSTAVVGQAGPAESGSISRRRQGQTGVEGTSTVSQYDLTTKREAGVVQSDVNGVSDGNFATDADLASTVLSFTIPLQFGTTSLVADTASANNLIWAYGEGDAIAYHGGRGEQAVTLSSAGTEAPSTVNIPTTEEPIADPSAGSAINSSDCTAPSGSVYDSQITMVSAGNGLSVTFAWTLDTNAGTLNVQAVSESSVGWLGIGFGETVGKMVPANAVVGQMSDQSVVSYALSARSQNGVQPTTSNEVVTDGSASIASADSSDAGATGTVITFRVPVSFVPGLEDGGETYIIWARGSGDIAQHSPNDQGSYTINLSTCVGQVTSSGFDTALLYSHGIMMALAWMLFVPLAISASAFRPAYTQVLGPNKSMWWFHSHRLFNTLAILLATAAFVVAFWLSSEDFVNTHQKLGLAVMIIMWLQPLNAFIRPHISANGEKRSTLRILWEVLHRALGYGAVSMAIVNVYLGLDEAVADNWLYIAFGVYVGVFVATFLALYAYYLFFYKGDSKLMNSSMPQDRNTLRHNTAEQSIVEGVSGPKVESMNADMLASKGI